MLKFFKKIMNSKKEVIKLEGHNVKLLNRIQTVSNIDLQSLVKDPASKVYNLNVYYTDFNSLSASILSKQVVPYICSVDLISYFKDHSDIHRVLFRIYDILKTNDISPYIESDLNEILDSFEFLNNLRKD